MIPISRRARGNIRDPSPINGDLATIWDEEAGDEVEKGRLSATRWSKQRNKFALAYVE